jgi:hypothetical protein
MESSIFGRLFKGIIKFIFSSLVMGAISLVASTSFMQGKFPPDWKHIKNMLTSIQKLRDFQKIASKGSGGGLDLSKLDINSLATGQGLDPEQVKQLGKQMAGQNNQNPLPTNQNVAGSLNQASSNKIKTNDDPELGDVNDLMQSHENMRKLAASLNGENVVANSQPINQVHRNVQQVAPPSAPTSVDGRLQALELQVENLTLKIRSLNATITDLSEKLDRIPKAKR